MSRLRCWKVGDVARSNFSKRGAVTVLDARSESASLAWDPTRAPAGLRDDRDSPIARQRYWPCPFWNLSGVSATGNCHRGGKRLEESPLASLSVHAAAGAGRLTRAPTRARSSTRRPAGVELNPTSVLTRAGTGRPGGGALGAVGVGGPETPARVYCSCSPRRRRDKRMPPGRSATNRLTTQVPRLRDHQSTRRTTASPAERRSAGPPGLAISGRPAHS